MPGDPSCHLVGHTGRESANSIFLITGVEGRMEGGLCCSGGPAVSGRSSDLLTCLPATSVLASSKRS